MHAHWLRSGAICHQFPGFLLILPGCHLYPGFFFDACNTFGTCLALVLATLLWPLPECVSFTFAGLNFPDALLSYLEYSATNIQAFWFASHWHCLHRNSLVAQPQCASRSIAVQPISQLFACGAATTTVTSTRTLRLPTCPRCSGDTQMLTVKMLRCLNAMSRNYLFVVQCSNALGSMLN